MPNKITTNDLVPGDVVNWDSHRCMVLKKTKDRILFLFPWSIQSDVDHRSNSRKFFDRENLYLITSIFRDEFN